MADEPTRRAPRVPPGPTSLAAAAVSQGETNAEDTPGLSLSQQIAGATATMTQAEAVLDLIGDYAESESRDISAVYGALTILRAAIQQNQAIEVAARQWVPRA